MSVKLEDFSLGKKVVEKGSLQKLGIVGCGSMGQEITILVSKAGIDVVFIDMDEASVKEIIANIELRLDEVIKRWGLTGSEKKAIMGRIKGSCNYEDLSDCEIVIETINSRKPGTNVEDRIEVFKNVEKVVGRDAVIASNTSTLMISELASVLDVPERSIGLHFISPVEDISIIEVVQGVRTNNDTMDMVTKFARMINKKLIPVSESPGNISTRMIVVMINEACDMLMEGVASVPDIDDTMKQASGHQFGPFEMADRIGLDKLLKWMDNLYQEFGDPRFKASPVIKRLVRANYLGKQSGAGFYKYNDGNIISHTLSFGLMK